MNISRKIKDIMYLQNISLTQLNDLLNEKNNTDYSVQNLSRKLSSNNLKFNDVEDILDVLGYSLEIVSNKHLDEVALTKTNCDEEHEEEEISDLFQGTSYLDSAIDSWLEKHIQQRIEVKSKEFFERVFPSPPFGVDGDDFIKKTTKDNEEK